MSFVLYQTIQRMIDISVAALLVLVRAHVKNNTDSVT